MKIFNLGQSWTLKMIVGVALMAPTVYSANCNTTGTVVVNNQTELDQFKGCTTLLASITPGDNYTGVFNLSGVTNMTGSIYTNVWVKGLTEMVLSDLTQINRLWVTMFPNMSHISAPKLLQAYDVELYGFSPMSVSFPSLVGANSISLAGTITGMDFPVLSTGSIVIERSPPPSMALSFPSLQAAPYLDIMGNITSISMPKLESIGPDAHNMTSDIGSNIPMNIDFPALKNISSLLLTSVLKFSMPSLVGISDALTLSVLNDTSIIFPSLLSASQLGISGRVSNVQFPKLQFASGDTYISSSIPLDCSSAQATYNHVTHSSSSSFSCKSFTDKPLHHGLSKAAKIGLGVGVGVGGLILCVLMAFALRRCTQSKEAAKKGMTRKEMAAVKSVEKKSGVEATMGAIGGKSKGVAPSEEQDMNVREAEPFLENGHEHRMAS